MRGWRHPLSVALFAALLTFSVAVSGSVAAYGEAKYPAPRRVVSMNLCTDQLAMLFAGQGQLHSISYLSTKPEVSLLRERARGFTINHGRAEEIFLMRPDLVLAGSFTKPMTVSMLRRLGMRVVTFAPAQSFVGIRTAIARMGRLLGRDEAAGAALAAFDKEVAALASKPRTGKRAAMYYANSYTSGRQTLAAEIVGRAGLVNLGSRLGYVGTVKLPLELLVMGRPDLVVGGRRMAREKSRSFEMVHHPALHALTRNHLSLVLSDKYWICGTPFTLRAVRALAAAARGIGNGARQ